ncbi:hypothetical protein [Elstera cyanobacteriorum]|uniref:hypothetical protein n=1 Tax=Elstera cyanobacteriorum TaxID=2022747 RepID=UPI002353DC24|nr:hypothetical protein [Elstera cyanobacteriorum]MCK6444557.1 hypothetical protein [Elstera cyanobacteriorum]
MVLRRLFALTLLLLPLPATAAEFSAEERQLVADIRRMMDKTTDLLIYAYTNETKMNLAEMKRVYKEFDQIADWFTKKIPYERYERRTGSFCHGAAYFAWSYWKDTTDYKEFNGTETQQIIGMPRNYQELKDRQKESLEGHFIVFNRCDRYLDQIPTELEDQKNAKTLSLEYMDIIRKESLTLFKSILNKGKFYNKNIILENQKQADEIYRHHHSLIKLIKENDNIGLACSLYTDFSKYFISHYLLTHGNPDNPRRLPDGLFEIGYKGLTDAYYTAAKICDNQIEKYRKENPQ